MSDRTKMDILRACNELLKYKEIDRISVMDIIEKADVSRATFYRYFKDKYALMNYNYKVIFDRAYQKSHSLYELMYQIYLQFSGGQLANRPRIHNYRGANSFQEYIFEYTMQQSEAIVKRSRGYGFTPEEGFQMAILCHGICGVSNMVMKHDYEENPELHTGIMFAMLPESIRDCWG